MTDEKDEIIKVREKIKALSLKVGNAMVDIINEHAESEDIKATHLMFVLCEAFSRVIHATAISNDIAVANYLGAAIDVLTGYHEVLS